MGVIQVPRSKMKGVRGNFKKSSLRITKRTQWTFRSSSEEMKNLEGQTSNEQRTVQICTQSHLFKIEKRK